MVDIAPNQLEQPSPLTDLLPSASSSSSSQFGKKQKSQCFRNPTQWENPKLVLPEHLRRSLASRMDDILASPDSLRCLKPCRTCEKVPDDVADAALALWDAQARSGAWPLGTAVIRAALLASGTEIGRSPLNKLLAHRRWLVLDRLVRDDVDAYNRQRADAGTLSGPQ
jgi:hypothetical protein